MAFSASTLKAGICSTSFSELYLPTCPLLTFDLILLHLLSITTLSLLLVILSIALSPSYHLSLSSLHVDGKNDPESMDAFVMWDLALASPPSSPHLERGDPLSGAGSRSYGAVAAEPMMGNGSYPQPTQTGQAEPLPIAKKDKFGEGRVWSYIPLLLCSIGAYVASIIAVVKTQSRYRKRTIVCYGGSSRQIRSTLISSLSRRSLAPLPRACQLIHASSVIS